jgi:DNA-binding transcriptional LysR family regulator
MVLKDLYRMAIFAKVVECGSFSAASVALGLGKSVVSHHVQALEQSLGIRLLNRSTRSLSLTEEGQRFYEPCLRVVHEAEAAHFDIDERKVQPRGTIRLTAPYNLGITFLLPALGKFRELNPGVDFDLVLEDSIVNIVEEGFDLALRAGWLVDSRLHAIALAPLEMIVCGAPKYFSKRAQPKQPEHLIDHPWISISQLPHPERITMQHHDGRRRTVRLRPSIKTNTGIAARELVMLGAGIGLLPDYAVKRELKAGRLVQVLRDWQLKKGVIAAAFPHRNYLAAKTKSLVEFLRSEFKAYRI